MEKIKKMKKVKKLTEDFFKSSFQIEKQKLKTLVVIVALL